VATTDLKLQAPGSLPPPGPVGRITRLFLGAACLTYVYGLLGVRGDLFDASGHIRSLIWNGLLPGLFLISYVVNIGFSRAWKKWPAVVSALLFAGVAVYGKLGTGQVESLALANALYYWTLYLFLHLGLAFVLSGLFRAPGCEMRAFHHLWGLITGHPALEHCCPVGILQPIDQWEASRKRA